MKTKLYTLILLTLTHCAIIDPTAEQLQIPPPCADTALVHINYLTDQISIGPNTYAASQTEDLFSIRDTTFFGNRQLPALLLFTPNFDHWCQHGHQLLCNVCSHPVKDYLVCHADYFGNCTDQAQPHSFVKAYGRIPFIAFLPDNHFWECYDGDWASFTLIADQPFSPRFQKQ